MTSSKFLYSLLLLGLATCSFLRVPGQSGGTTTSSDFSLLRLSNSELSADHPLQEATLDMVEVFSLDDSLPADFTPHQPFFMGRFFRWKKMYPSKQRFIGTTTRDNELHHNSFIKKEYDVCFFLIPHLRKYINQAEVGVQNIKGKPGTRLYQPCLTCPDPLKVFDEKTGVEHCIYVECECTPNPQYLDSLFTQFYPCTEQGTPSEAACTPSDSLPVGVYGAFVSDCLHHCKPEVHPYDWVWWLDTGIPNDHRKEWRIGFFGDRSERFAGWVPTPRQGSIAIPFSYPAGEKLTIELETLVVDSFRTLPDELKQAPEESVMLSGNGNFGHPLPSGGSIRLSIQGMEDEGAAFWLSRVQESNGNITGYFHLSLSVESLFTAKVGFESTAVD